MRQEAGIEQLTHAVAQEMFDLHSTELAVTVERGSIGLIAHVWCRWDGSQPSVLPMAGEPGEEEVEVRPQLTILRTDLEIAGVAALAMRRALPNSYESAKLTIKQGWLTIEGDLEWLYQRQRLRDALSAVVGVAGISDHTVVSSHLDASEIRHRAHQPS
jgi:hypothetical protein